MKNWNIQEKYETASASLAEMEKRVVMAETMLEATLQYQSGQTKAQPSPRLLVLQVLCFKLTLCVILKTRHLKIRGIVSLLLILNMSLLVLKF